MIVTDAKVVDNYKSILMRMLPNSFPNLTPYEISEAIDYSINKRYMKENARVYDNYRKSETHVTLLELTEYILSKEPIITPYGVMFQKHGTMPNPLAKMIQTFMEGRDVYKKEMFKYPKGSDSFEKYNLLQLLAKIDANGLYGAMGMYSCLFYNLHVAASTTLQGRSLVSAAGLLIEMFLANSVKFASLNEVITFIDNITTEERKYNDRDILDNNITSEQCFAQLILTCGYEWIPTYEEQWAIWDVISKLRQEDLNRVYYKNNLYEFMENSSMVKAITNLLKGMNKPYLNPNKVPDEIKVELEVFSDIVKEYVYYSYQIIDRIDRMDNMIKNVCLISDTDSTIVSLDAWYRFVLEKVKGIPMEITNYTIDPISFITADEFGDRDLIQPIEFIEPELDFDFYNDEIVEMERLINPIEIIPQDSLRYSIINIMAYCLGNYINDYMVNYTKNSGSWAPDKKCLIIMKNEFLFKRALLLNVKKSYATIQELQEGNMIPNNIDASLDVKGIDVLAKSTTNKTTRDRLKAIVYEDILNIPHIDQVNVLKKLAIFEKQIYNSLVSGNKEYYKPQTVKAMNSYDDPMRISGIKAAIVWNKTKGDLPGIDLEVRNSLSLVKVDITPIKVERIKDDYPEVYKGLIELMQQKEFNTISAIAIPVDIETPKWIMEFIDYVTIINNNLKGFPLESIGLMRMDNDNLNYTNILKI